MIRRPGFVLQSAEDVAVWSRSVRGAISFNCPKKCNELKSSTVREEQTKSGWNQLFYFDLLLRLWYNSKSILDTPRLGILIIHVLLTNLASAKTSFAQR